MNCAWHQFAAFGRAVCIFTFTAFGVAAQGVVDLLPDMIVDESVLTDYEIRNDIRPGKIHLILSNGTANIGDGPLHIFARKQSGKGDDDLTQPVRQRIFRSDGSHYSVPAGNFLFHPQHNHIHFDDWTIYRLRQVLPGDGVGKVVAKGRKTSFCLLDSFVYDNTLPGFSFVPAYSSCNNKFQGISVGYEDVYDKTVPGQWIDITEVPNGEYWLESEVDPKNHVVEKDETNNIARIKVTIDKSAVIAPPPNPGPDPVGLLEALALLIQQLLAFLRSGGQG